jgi:hypothetical protein
MHRKHPIAIFGLLLFSFGLASDSRSQVRHGRTHPAEPCPDEKAYTGKYRNQHYGFSITIPMGLKGYWNSARCVQTDEGCICMSDHGRVIPLSEAAHIEAFASYETLEWSPRDYEKNEIANVKKREGIEGVRVLRSKGILLGNIEALRLAIQFSEKNKSVIEDRIIAVHKGVEYELILYTLADRYQTDRETFEKVIASWKLTPRMG